VTADLPSDSHVVLAIDTETHTPLLKTHGPRCIQGDDYAIGISVAGLDGFSAYYPLRHNEGNGPSSILDYLRGWLAKPTNKVIFANAKFDIEMLWSLGLDIKCECYDVLAVDALIDENQSSYSLEAISKRYGFVGKAKTDMEAWMFEHKIVRAHNKKLVDMGRMREVPPEVVAPYAIRDAELTLACYRAQQTPILKQGLGRVVQLENDLLPVLWAMRLEGVPVDLARAEQLNIEMTAQGEAYLQEVRDTHPTFNPMAARSLGQYVESFKRYPPLTNTGEPSVTNEWLEGSDIQELRDVALYRRAEKIRRDFVEGVVLETAHKGKIHTSWASTRGVNYGKDEDPEGTRTGRIASNNPNLAQIPRRHKILGPKARSMFVPRKGEVWHKADYSSQEPRITLHYAAKRGLPGAEDMAERYGIDKTLDYHQTVTDMVNGAGPRSPIDRDAGKTINLGVAYGLGKVKLAENLRMSLEQSEALMATYHRAIPYVKPLQRDTKAYAEKAGFINTELGRRRRFDLWEKDGFGLRTKPLPEAEAFAEYKYIKRSKTYKALNACVQGTAAEQIKLAMIQLHSEGLTPLITLYDELGHSIPDDPKISARICEVMENALPLLVPHHVEALMGPSWDLRKDKK
jgi:DNA polymerase-1